MAVERPDDDWQLVATGLSSTGPGGLFVIANGEVETIDTLASTGFAVSPTGDRAARLLWTDDDPQGIGELVIYDARGALAYHRIDELREPHSALWDGAQIVVVSTLDDTVLWLDAAGQVTRRWVAHGGGDCCHLNCLVRHNDRLVVSAFGRFAEHRAWARPGARAGTGLLIDLETNESIVTGLDAPHDPTFDNGRWLICNSGQQELLATSEAGEPLGRVPLDGWTRGLALDREELHVGVSASRKPNAIPGHARVATLDRATLEPLREVALPCPEVYALTWVPPALLEGLRAGFRTNRLRVSGQQQLLDSGVPNEQALEDAATDVHVDIVGLPATAIAGSWFPVTFHAHNHGPAALRSLGDYPVMVGSRWTLAGQLAGEQRAQLARPLLPGGSGVGRLFLQAPEEPGAYDLHVALVQEFVRWFSDGAPDRGFDGRIDVVARDAANS